MIILGTLLMATVIGSMLAAIIYLMDENRSDDFKEGSGR